MNTPRLTICSVYHSLNSKTLLEMNEELTRRLNPGASWTWLACDNSPETARIPVDPARFSVVRGIDHPVLERIFVPPIDSTYHHTLGLNALLPHSGTRWALFLDPDFFIVRPGWIGEVLDYMEARGLAAMGATWHPAYYGKIRYAPAQYCLFIDGAQLPHRALDFTPGYLSHDMFRGKNPHGTFPKKGTPLPARTLIQKIARNILNRRDIGVSRDAGYAISAGLLAGRLPYECIPSVFKHPRPGPMTRIIDRLLPDRWSYFPKKLGYYVTEGFREAGVFDFYAMGMEEHMWKGAPFATHIRNVWKRNDITKELEVLREHLKGF